MAFAACLLVVITAIAVHTWLGMKSLRALRDVGVSSVPWTRVSVVFAARNEETHLEAALLTLLNQSYPNLEIIVANDRSTDRTGEILASLQRRHPSLQVVTIDELPKGWLGKNHALHKAAKRATGEYILFTDADIFMDPSVLARAMTYVLAEKADHLTLFPKMKVPTLLAKFFAGYFMVTFNVFVRSWRVHLPNSKEYVGIGAFNLVRADAYRRSGGHEALRLLPDDDVMLGRQLKRAGFSARILDGAPLVHFHWYPTLGDAIRAFEKNFFAGLNFSIATTVLATIFNFTFFVWPFVGVFATSGVTSLLYLAIVLVQWSLFGASIRHVGEPWWWGLGLPIGCLLFSFTLWRSMFFTLKNGGIRWRDTFYPLAELKAARPKMKS